MAAKKPARRSAPKKKPTRRTATKRVAPRRVSAAPRVAPARQWESVAPPPPAPATKANTWAMLAHLSAFGMVLVPFGNVVGPFVVWLAKGKDPFVADQGKESLNFQISMTIYGLAIGALLLTFVASGVAGDPPLVDTSPYIPPVAVGTPILVLFWVYVLFDIVVIIVAAVRASLGIAFRYPLRIRFVR